MGDTWERYIRDQERAHDMQVERNEIELAVEAAMVSGATTEDRKRARHLLRGLMDRHYGAA